jgi:hypothetical protein
MIQSFGLQIDQKRAKNIKKQPNPESNLTRQSLHILSCTSSKIAQKWPLRIRNKEK